MTKKYIGKLPTFLTVLVTDFFSSGHGDKNGRSLGHYKNMLAALYWCLEPYKIPTASTSLCESDFIDVS